MCKVKEKSEEKGCELEVLQTKEIEKKEANKEENNNGLLTADGNGMLALIWGGKWGH